MASGIKAQFDTMAIPLNAGLAARTGVEAALWAQSGMTAAHDGLAGPLGFGATHHGQGAEFDLAQDAWRILKISHKFHACCHGLPAMLEGLRKAGLTGAEVDTLHILTHPRWMSVCNLPAPQTGLAAIFSYAQTAAMTLMGHDTGTIASFTDQITQDAQIMDLRARITVSEDARLTETQPEVAVTLRDGSTRQLRHDLLTPMTIESRAAKLRTKAETLVRVPHAQTLWSASQSSALRNFTDQLAMS